MHDQLWKSTHWWQRHPWIWHATFDGTWLCRCPRSEWMKKLEV